MNAEDRWQRLIADPATPDWVKAVLDLVVRLDPVDAANGLEVIADVAARRADEVLVTDLAAGSGEDNAVELTRFQDQRDCTFNCVNAHP